MIRVCPYLLWRDEGHGKKNIAVFDLDGTLVETDAANNAA